MNEPMVKLAGLYEKTSAKGNKYFIGRLGNARLLMFANQDKQAEKDPDWLLYVQERNEEPAKSQRPGDGIPDPGWPTRRQAA
jgi:hypothetical protein